MRIVTFDEFKQKVSTLPENQGATELQIYNAWDETFGKPQRQAMAEADGPVAYSVDQAQKLMGAGLRTFGEGLGSERLENFGQGVVDQQDQDIEAGNYQPQYQGSFRDNLSEGGIKQGAGWAFEKALENVAYSGGAIAGGALAAIAAPFSVPLSLLIGGVTIAGSGLGITGETALEMEEKGVDVNPGLAIGAGVIGGTLERFGLGRLFPSSKLAGMTGKELVQELAEKGHKEAAKVIAKEIVKRTGAEVGAELGQEATITGASAMAGAQYEADELIDRAIDTMVVSGTLSAPYSVTGTIRDSMATATPVETAPEQPKTLEELRQEQLLVEESLIAQAETAEQQAVEAVAAQGGDALDMEFAKSETRREYTPDIAATAKALRETNQLAQTETEKALAARDELQGDIEAPAQAEPVAIAQPIERTELFARPTEQPVAAEIIEAPAQETLKTNQATTLQTNQEPKPVLQNRDRKTQASIEQMTNIAANPDYGRLGFSRDFGNGAPVIEPGIALDESNLGKADYAVTGEGRRIPVQYAVVEADQLLPSNRSDGTPNTDYETGIEGVSRAIAGNGRVAGLQGAFTKGTAEQYKQSLIDDAELTGINPQTVQSMQKPVLVRVMPKEEITSNIGDESNTSGVSQLSPSEQARNDAQRVDAAQIPVSDEGVVTRQAAQAFIATMPQSERGSLMDGSEPNRKAYERLENLIFSEAFESPELLRLQADATDTEVKNIMAGLRVAAAKLARLKGAGDLDVRDLVREAAEVAVNAKRSGQKLADYIQQSDMQQNPEIMPILRMMVENSRSAKKIGQSLSDMADMFYAESQRGGADMFGNVEQRNRQQLMGEVFNGEQTSTADIGQQGRPGIDDASTERGAETEQAENASSEDGAQSDPQPSEELTLQPQTQADLDKQQAEQVKAQQEAVEDERKASERELADKDRNDFDLTGSDSKRDVMAAQGQNELDMRPEAAEQSINDQETQTVETTEETTDILPDTKPEAEVESRTDQPNSADEKQLADTSDVGGELLGNLRQKGSSAQSIRTEENGAIKVDMAKKPKLWQKPDYQAMVDGGVQPEMAHIVKQIYDALPTKPPSTRDEYINAYADGVERVREALDVMLADKSVMDAIVAELSTGSDRGSIIDSLKPGNNVARNWLIDRVFPENEDGKRWVRGTESYTVAQAVGNKAIDRLQVSRSMMRKAREAVSEGFPSPREKWQISYNIVEKDGKFGVVPKNRYTAISSHETQEEAISAAKELVTVTREQQFAEPETSPEMSTRVGADRRNGRNVSSEELREAFNFKAINFGEWLKGTGNAKERQSHVNSAYDAFMDLAEILSLPPQAMSLGGKLGIAIGAQGKGKYAAHFYPGYNEINLTRRTGAGSLAHEWGHALDHYFAVQADLAKKTDPFLSAFTYFPKSGELRKEILDAFKGIDSATKTKDYIETPEETEKVRQSYIERGTKELERIEKYLINRIEASGNAQQVIEAKTIMGKIKDGKPGDYTTLGRTKDSVFAEVNAMRELYKSATGNYFGKDSALSLHSAAYSLKVGKDQSLFSENHRPQRIISTEYYKAAKGKDAGKSKSYWATPWEMFARAFEIYVLDKAAESAGRNDYLTSAWKGIGKTGNELYDTVIGGESVSRYPQNDERIAINKAFDALFDVVETKETEQGVMLYSQGEGEGMSLTDAEATLNQDKRLARAISKGKLKVVQSGSDIPVGADTLASRSGKTTSEYESRIDALMDGDKPKMQGVKILDRSDMLSMLGMSDGPVHIVEGKVSQGRFNHRLTAEHWKKIPEWLDGPAAVFDSETVSDRLVFIAPETIDGKLVRLIVEPRGDGDGVNLLINAYDADRNPISRWFDDGLLVYVDERKTPNLERSGLQLPRLSSIRGYGRKIHSGKDLFKYRRENKLESNDGVIQGAYLNGTAYVVADGNSEQSIVSTAWHELTHAAMDAQGDTFITPEVKQKLFNRLSNQVKLARNSKKDSPLKRAIARAENAGTADAKFLEEVAGYLVTDYVNQSDSLTGSIRQWAQDLIAAIQSAVLRFSGIQVGSVTGAELNAIAKAYADYVTLSDRGRGEQVAEAAMSEDEVGILYSKSEVENVYDRAFESLGDKDKTVFNKMRSVLKRELLPGGLLPDSVFKAKIQRDSEMNGMEFDIANRTSRLDRAIQKVYGKPYKDVDPNELLKINEALGSPEPDMSLDESIRQEVYAMRNLIRGMSQKYANQLQREIDTLRADGSNAAAESKAQLLETIMNNLDTYVHRSYRAFDDPNWPKRVSREVYDAAARYLEKQYAGKGEVTAAIQDKAAKTIELMLEDGTAFDSMEAFIKESKLGAKDLSVLQRRKQIAPEIRELLGEYKDPKVNFTKSVTKMTRLVFNQTFLDQIREIGLRDGFLFDKDNRPLDATKMIAADSSETYAPLNGLYTFPEIDQAFRDALGKEEMAGWFRAIVRANGMVKFGKTVLSPTTAARNWMSAMFFALANGHFDFTQMKHSLGSIREYFSQTGNKAEYLKKLKTLGVIYDTPYAGEMMDLLSDSNLERSLFDKKPFSNIKQTLDFAQKFYQYGDDFWKIMGFENEKALLIKHKGMSEVDAEIEAAERIRNTYPTYSMTGRFVQRLRRFPLAGTFVSFPAEIIRTSYHIMRYLKADIKDTPALGRRKVAGFIIASGAIHAMQYIAKILMGMSDDEEEAFRDLAAPWQRNSNIIPLGYDKDGKVRLIDMSFLDPYNYWKRPINAMLRDQPFQDAAIDSAREMLSPFFGEDIAYGAISEVMNNKKASGGRVFNPNSPAMDQTADIADHIRKALQPGAFANAERIIKAASGEVSASGRPYTMKDEMSALVGFRITTFDPKSSIYYKAFEFQDKKRDATSIFNSIARNPNKISDRQLTQAYQNAVETRIEAYEEMIRLIKAAMASGLTRSEAIRTLRNSGVSKADSLALVQGRIPPWKPSNQSMANAVKRADVLFDPKITARLKERQELIRKEFMAGGK